MESNYIKVYDQLKVNNDKLREEHEKKLKELFNINGFYDQQWKAIDQILKKQKVLLIEKTGYGK